jgi:hypothetical protein
MKYCYTIEGLIEYLKEKRDAEFNEWMSDFLLYGHTNPLIGVDPNEDRSFIVEDLYTSCKEQAWRYKVRNAIIEIFKITPLPDFDDKAFIDFLRVITLLNITELLPELYKYADGRYKGKKSEYIRDYIDKHTIVLRSLFGLCTEIKETDNIIRIAKRDITDEKYMLECFYFLSRNYKTSSQCVKYIPLLLRQAEFNIRDYSGVIDDYLRRFRAEELVQVFVKICKSEIGEEGLFTFQNITIPNGISIEYISDTTLKINGYADVFYLNNAIQIKVLQPMLITQSKIHNIQVLHYQDNRAYLMNKLNSVAT